MNNFHSHVINQPFVHEKHTIKYIVLVRTVGRNAELQIPQILSLYSWCRPIRIIAHCFLYLSLYQSRITRHKNYKAKKKNILQHQSSNYLIMINSVLKETLNIFAINEYCVLINSTDNLQIPGNNTCIDIRFISRNIEFYKKNTGN